MLRPQLAPQEDVKLGEPSPRATRRGGR